MFASLIEPMRDRPGVSRSQVVRASLPAQWPPRDAVAKWKRTDVPVVENAWNLTPMQCAVMTMRTQGDLHREIADKLAISPKTVWSHLNMVREKMGVETLRMAEQLWARSHREAT